jgi:hypothetical protein
VAFLPRGLTSFGAATLDGWLYVLGGYHGEPHKYSKEGQSDDFYRINLRDPRQIEALDGGVPIQGAPLVARNGRVIRAGGMVAANARGEQPDLRSVADARAWDASTRTWSALPPLPDPRSSHDMAVLGDKVVVVGGWTLGGETSRSFLRDAVVLDLARIEDGWKRVDAPFACRALTAAPFGDRVLVAGGMDEDGEMQRTVSLLDPATGRWERGPDFPGEPFGLAAAGASGSVLASGRDGVVWRLDKGAKEWSRAGTLAFPRFFHRIVPDDDGSVLVLGGIDDMRPAGRVRAIERIDARPTATSATATLIELPAPFCAKNRQGAFLRGNVLTLFGGNRSLDQHDFEREDFQTEAFALDLASLTWKKTAAFPERRQTIACSQSRDGKTGYALGGFGFAGGKAVSRASAFRYSFERDDWHEAPELELPQPRTQAGFLRHGDDLWVFGGLDYDPERDPAFIQPLEVLSCDLAAENVRFSDTGLKLTQPRRAFAGAVLGDKAYLVGGMRERFDLVPECEVFDFETRTFATMPQPRRTRVSAQLVAMDGKLYLCGGSSKGANDKLTPDHSVEVYDPSTGKWQVVLEALPAPMPQMQAFAWRDRLLIVSSHVQGLSTTRVVILSP